MSLLKLSSMVVPPALNEGDGQNSPPQRSSKRQIPPPTPQRPLQGKRKFWDNNDSPPAPVYDPANPHTFRAPGPLFSADEAEFQEPDFKGPDFKAPAPRTPKRNTASQLTERSVVQTSTNTASTSRAPVSSTLTLTSTSRNPALTTIVIPGLDQQITEALKLVNAYLDAKLPTQDDQSGFETSVKFILKMAEHGIPNALYILGDLHALHQFDQDEDNTTTFTKNGEPNYPFAAKCYQLAAKADHDDAMLQLANLILNGHIERDPTTNAINYALAAKYAKHASELGNFEAHKLYISLILNGLAETVNGQPNIELAAEICQKSAILNDAFSCFTLSQILGKHSVPKVVVESKRREMACLYLGKAADLGHEQAKILVDQLFA